MLEVQLDMCCAMLVLLERFLICFFLALGFCDQFRKQLYSFLGDF